MNDRFWHIILDKEKQGCKIFKEWPKVVGCPLLSPKQKRRLSSDTLVGVGGMSTPETLEAKKMSKTFCKSASFFTPLIQQFTCVITKCHVLMHSSEKNMW